MGATHPMQQYAVARDTLARDPKDRAAQHQAVLALARMGSLRLAEDRYREYELDRVRHHEDIMALGGRLAKDAYLRSSGKTAREHARTATERYEAAFKDTGGWYSGINAATMAYLADMPRAMVTDRVQAVLDALPQFEDRPSEDVYYCEATRAECFLLLGQSGAAQHALRDALNHDPLNYTAHATTLKQFRLILNKRGDNAAWLAEFSPPRPAHFAGHIHGLTDSTKNGDMRDAITDLIQAHDIGAGHGALAAGADILIAEGLLEQGAELHIYLPGPVEAFLDRSVRPFGEKWESRFMDCLNAAASISTRQSGEADRLLAGYTAMGQACLQARYFDVTPAQILIQDSKSGRSLTQDQSQIWAAAGLDQFTLPISRDTRAARPWEQITLPRVIVSTAQEKIGYDHLQDALDDVSIDMATQPNQARTLGFEGPEITDLLAAQNAQPFRDVCLASESVAAMIALSHADQFTVRYAGQINAQTPAHIFTIDPIRS